MALELSGKHQKVLPGERAVGDTDCGRKPRRVREGEDNERPSADHYTTARGLECLTRPAILCNLNPSRCNLEVTECYADL